MTSFKNINVVNSLALASDGKIIAAGSCGDKAVPSNQMMFTSRFSESGSRESFALSSFFAGRDAGASGVVIQPDGKLIYAGYTTNSSNNFLQFAAVRYLP